jgi:xylose isomerase
LNGKVSLQQIHDDLIASGHEPEPVSGRQELLERLVARHIDTVR